ncbi:ABC transporter substrate-binding protein [Polaromonas sp. JS666]|uniref:ABC transporter substrate-binding protein n=1 Tax=Polaromonas sp. (strain JS666 / ATCC BAA-500) TaxID=296591 RepID=UPI002686BABB
MHRSRGPAIRWVLVAALSYMLPTVQAASCVAGNPLRVVQSIDLSGPQRWVGVEYAEGAQLLLRRVTRNGGVHGKTVDMAVTDDKFDPKQTAANVGAATMSSVCAVFGTMGTGHTMAAIEAAGNVPVVAPLTGTAAVRKPMDGKAFFVRGTYNDEVRVRAIIRHAKAVGLTRFALVVPSDSFGSPVIPVYRDAVEKEGGKASHCCQCPQSTPRSLDRWWRHCGLQSLTS